MKTYTYTLLFILAAFTVKGQQSEVVKVLNRFQIDTSVLHHKAKENAAAMAFDLKQVTRTSASEKIALALFDGSKPDGNKWNLNSVNGKQPSLGQVKSFLKAHPVAPLIPVIDQNSYKIVSDKDDQLVVEFRYDADKLSPENLFMKDCKGQLFINAKTKLLEKQIIQNMAPLKVNGIKIAKLLTVSTFTFNQGLKQYLPLMETTNMVIQLLALTSDSEIISEYSNYKNP
ncbi:hypothetical protein ACFE6N_20525 [Pedobacter sp. BG31]|uniref:hypothetical protein n=1 Tax=Pedobacter sp. BG31 TaxID=3349697 RepID=UPI0035F3472E